jgi:hypothetical protein
VTDRPWFDDFSWQEFIALNWPATGDVRGAADPTRPFGAAANYVVWGTRKSLDELFPPPPAEPTPWESYDAALSALGPERGVVKDAGKRRLLSQALRLAAVTQASFGAARLPPLVAQNGTYVRYEVRVNQVAYEYIRTNRYFLGDAIAADRAKQGGGRLEFPPGSIVVKAAWMELTAADSRGRFYYAPAEIPDPVVGSPLRLRPATVGLVGLHIAQKTRRHPSWVWSSFEHVDNTEPGPGAARASFSKNDPDLPHTDHNVDRRPPVPCDAAALPPMPQPPVDVERLNPVPPATNNMNLRYHRSPAVRGTVWQNYRLVATQWVVSQDGSPDTGDPAHLGTVLPPGGIANTTIETYSQGSSCLRCHTTTTDFRFIFFPTIRAVPPKPVP